MATRTWNIANFIEAVKTNTTIMGVLQDLGLRVTNGNYSTVKKYVKTLSLDTSHWLGQKNGKGRPAHNRQELVSILVANSTYTSNVKLKKRLIQTGALVERCSICLLETWNNKPITLQLDHENGVHSDNRIENLRLLCPNCHSQTPTFCGRNKKIRF